MITFILSLSLLGCTEKEVENVESESTPVEQGPDFQALADDGMSVDLEPERYLGVWYEIATILEWSSKETAQEPLQNMV